MVEIVKRLGWSYVSIIYEESNYGIKVSGYHNDSNLSILFMFIFRYT